MKRSKLEYCHTIRHCQRVLPDERTYTIADNICYVKLIGTMSVVNALVCVARIRYTRSINDP